MSFAILRVQKLKTFGNIGGSLSHNYRNRKTLNADIKRADLNEHDLKTNQQTMSAIQNRIPEKRRKDAVLCIEHLITASPDWSGWGTEKESEFFEKSKKWLEEKYGKDNLISTTIHRDETTPHLVAYVVPLDESTGRLNAKKWLGGTRHTLTKMQTHFANHVKSLGLERGLEGSKAEHTTIKSFYAEIQKPVSALKSRILKIEKLGYDQQPKYHFLDAKILHGERVMNAVYESVEQQINTFNKDVTVNFSDMHINFEKKLVAEKLRADKFEKAHEKAVLETRKLREEYEIISEYKRLFPVEFEKLEELLCDDVKNFHKNIEQEKNRKEYESKMIIKRQREVAQQQENNFKVNIAIKRQKRLDAQHSHFLERMSKCTSQPEKIALKRIYDERNAFLKSRPVDVMNEVLKTDKQNYYFGLCSLLFRVKRGHDFDSALKESIKFFELTAPSYEEGIGFHESSITRKVCAASLNQLDNLLVGYGSEYAEQAEILRKHLLACEEKAEQNSFEYVLNDVTSEEQRKKYTAENSINHDFSMRQPVKEINKEKGFDVELDL